RTTMKLAMAFCVLVSRVLASNAYGQASCTLVAAPATVSYQGGDVNVTLTCNVSIRAAFFLRGGTLYGQPIQCPSLCTVVETQASYPANNTSGPLPEVWTAFALRADPSEVLPASAITVTV